MTTDFPASHQTPELRSLWQEAFGDDNAYLDCFFSEAFSCNRSRCITAGSGQIAAALYWFDCTWNGRKLAYLYAVATRKSFRHQGLALQLLQDTHNILKSAGYQGTILMPAETELCHLYEQAGYVPATRVREYTVTAGEPSVIPAVISGSEYALLRQQYLPEGSVLMDSAAMNFLSTQLQFYKGADFLFCGDIEGDTLIAQEFLGNEVQAPGILGALHLQKGRIRSPGQSRLFTMYCPLDGDFSQIPTYFGLPMD